MTCANDPYTAYSFHIFQVLELKKNNPGVLLMVEVGYKLKFFGDDAKVSCRYLLGHNLMINCHFQIASTELGIACFPNRNFIEAMIPVHRRDVHLKKYAFPDSRLFYDSPLYTKIAIQRP